MSHHIRRGKNCRDNKDNQNGILSVFDQYRWFQDPDLGQKKDNEGEFEYDAEYQDEAKCKTDIVTDGDIGCQGSGFICQQKAESDRENNKIGEKGSQYKKDRG